MLKQITAQKLRPTLSPTAGDKGGAPKHFWQGRYYDFNVRTPEKRVEKLRYMHRNPVKRGLVERPEDWGWSSFRHYATGVEGVVEIESEWTGRKREHGNAVASETRAHPLAKRRRVGWGTPGLKSCRKGWPPGPALALYYVVCFAAVAYYHVTGCLDLK
jgi:hypothetical protein